MTRAPTNTPRPSWSDAKKKLAEFDRAGLMALIHDIYSASKDNQAFLNARLSLGYDVLEPYRTTIGRALWPDVFKAQNPSILKAKKAISAYKGAIGRPEGLVELMVFYCEQAAGFANEVGFQDEGYFVALVRMFDRALNGVNTLPGTAAPKLLARLDTVRRISHNFGYGVGDAMDELLAEFEGVGGAH